MKRRNRYLLVIALVALAIGLTQAYPSAKLTTSAGDIKFSHKLHVTDNGIECVTCHVSIDTSAHASDNNYPAMDICGGCHDQVNDDTKCGICHANATEPGTYADLSRPIAFNHAKHLAQKATCESCHSGIASAQSSETPHMPSMSLCLDCHDGTRADGRCELCHAGQITLADIHPIGWRHQHGQQANLDSAGCNGCHKDRSACIACHRGDNLNGKIHDLNYRFTHGLDAKSKALECRQCHDERNFCDECHIANHRMPLNHSTATWRTRHGETARSDPEDCASCHETADPTCGRVGCHNDFDGIRGNAPRLHRDASDLMSHGPWHSDRGYFCYQCHTYAGRAGVGFCGYCHGQEDH